MSWLDDVCEKHSGFVHVGPNCIMCAEGVASRPDWQPIETAPKDGTRILVYVPDSENVLSVYWDDEFVFKFDEAKAESTEYQGEHEGAWTDDAVKSWAYQEKESYHPNYWMPFPESPTI